MDIQDRIDGARMWLLITESTTVDMYVNGVVDHNTVTCAHSDVPRSTKDCALRVPKVNSTPVDSAVAGAYSALAVASSELPVPSVAAV